MEYQSVSPNTSACIVPDNGWCWSNAGFVTAGDGLMVDTFMDVATTRRALSLHDDAGRRQPERLVNTHHNPDHCWGNQLFRDREIIAHERCAELMKGELGPELFVSMASAEELPPGFRWFMDDASAFDFSEVEVTPPNRTIQEDTRLEIGGVKVDLLYVGPAHTAGDVIVHLPDEGVLFAGDILFRCCTPIGWEGTFRGWDDALTRIIELAPETIVPGHGPLCGVEGATELRDYLRMVRSECERHFAAERTPFEAAQRIELGPFAAWTQPERLIFNVARAYRELRGGAEDEVPPFAELMDQAVALRPLLRR